MNSPSPPPSPATPTDRACAVPLVELLRAVPHDARYTYTETDGVKATHFIPIGRYAHEAAELIASLQSRLAEVRFPQSATVPVPRGLVERAMESCQVNNDHYAWKELLRCLDPAGAPK